MPKYPEIEVQLTGTDGNAYAILGTVQGAMKSAGIDAGEIDQFHSDATAGDYDNLLRVATEWVSVS